MPPQNHTAPGRGGWAVMRERQGPKERAAAPVRGAMQWSTPQGLPRHAAGLVRAPPTSRAPGGQTTTPPRAARRHSRIRQDPASAIPTAWPRPGRMPGLGGKGVYRPQPWERGHAGATSLCVRRRMQATEHTEHRAIRFPLAIVAVRAHAENLLCGIYPMEKRLPGSSVRSHGWRCTKTDSEECPQVAKHTRHDAGRSCRRRRY